MNEQHQEKIDYLSMGVEISWTTFWLTEALGCFRSMWWGLIQGLWCLWRAFRSLWPLRFRSGCKGFVRICMSTGKALWQWFEGGY